MMARAVRNISLPVHAVYRENLPLYEKVRMKRGVQVFRRPTPAAHFIRMMPPTVVLRHPWGCQREDFAGGAGGAVRFVTFR